MFKKPTKRQFIIRRIILSTIATFSVIIIATVAILFMLGYRLDSGNGRLEQGALLQFDSKPNGADVYVDGYSIGSRTATKHTVVAGEHTIKMSRAGYQDWTRTLKLTAGTLTWLDYTRFVPNDRPVQKVLRFDTMTTFKASPDSKWALVHESAASPVFQLIDLRSETVKKNPITLPAASYSDADTPEVTHAFSPITWDSGSRYVLVKHLYRDQTEWIVFDTQNATQALNITQVFSTGFKDVVFAGTSGKQLYGLTNEGTVRKIDLSNETLSRAFVTHVESFNIFDNTIISYVGIDPNDATKRVAGVYRDGDDTSHILHTASSLDAPVRAAFTRYFSDVYVAVSEGSVVTVLKGLYPGTGASEEKALSRVASFKLDAPLSSLSFSESGDFLVAQAGENFTSYEVEHKRTATHRIILPEGKSASTLKWLDPAHLWNDDGGTLMMRDFNGSNIYSIMTVEPGFGASLSQNGRFFYGIGKDDDGYHVQRVKMILS